MSRAEGHELGPKERALADLWQSVRYRLHTPRYLWTWLELRRRFDLTFVRAAKLKVMVPSGLVPDCESCTDLCCTGPNAVVSLRLSDIAALVDVGLERHMTHERPQLEESQKTWARWEADWSVFHRAFPVLKRDATGTCSLLTEDRQCGAYPAWPLSCARYPYALDVLNNRVFLAKGCQSHRQVTIDDTPGGVRRLIDNTVRAYNERVRDVILVHIALEELHGLGLLAHLKLEGRLGKRANELLSVS